MDTEEVTVLADEPSLNIEFTAMSLGNSNDIHFTTYALSSFSDIPPDHPLLLSLIAQGYNLALESACTNHIFCNKNIFHMYNTGGAVPVKTANCGFLTILGIRDVKIRLKIGD